jgi:hypothetical protein
MNLGKRIKENGVRIMEILDVQNWLLTEFRKKKLDLISRLWPPTMRVLHLCSMGWFMGCWLYLFFRLE